MSVIGGGLGAARTSRKVAAATPSECRHTCYSHRSISGAKLSHDEQRAMSREWNRASATRRGNSPKLGGFKGHDYISRERTERQTACHARTTGRVVAGV